MTPEQIERLGLLRKLLDSDVWHDDEGSFPIRIGLLRALLAEWEERGKQVEAFQRIVPRVEGERDAMYEEVERLSEQLRLCTVPDGWETWRRNAEARLARVVEAARAIYYAAFWTPDRECEAIRLWTELRDACGFKPGESTRLLAAAQPKEKR